MGKFFSVSLKKGEKNSGKNTPESNKVPINPIFDTWTAD
jgi:hypothetical protein